MISSGADDRRESFQEDLFMVLRRMEAALREAPKAENSREAVCAALDAVIEFINSIEQFEEDGLAALLWALRCALSDLERGIVVPLLTPASTVKSSGRKPDPTLRKLFKGFVTICVDHMKKSGLTVEAACREVARDSRALGFRIEGKRDTTDWETLRTWRHEVSRLPEGDYERHLLQTLRRHHLPSTSSPEKARGQMKAFLKAVRERLGPTILD
jgi:hypothetical protein